MGAAENDRKHDDLFEWDPWVSHPLAGRKNAWLVGLNP